MKCTSSYCRLLPLKMLYYFLLMDLCHWLVITKDNSPILGPTQTKLKLLNVFKFDDI